MAAAFVWFSFPSACPLPAWMMNPDWRITAKKMRQWASHEKGIIKPESGEKTHKNRKGKTSRMRKRKLSRRRSIGDCQRMDISLLPAHSPQEVGVLQEGAGGSEHPILPLSCAGPWWMTDCMAQSAGAWVDRKANSFTVYASKLFSFSLQQSRM